MDGHAIVVVGASRRAWLVKNSWGHDFADEGYFRVAKNAIDFKFYDVHFLEADLTTAAIWAYNNAPALLQVRLLRPTTGPYSVQSLGLVLDFQSMRVERVRRRSCLIADWNRHYPFRRVLPGYEIWQVNGQQTAREMIAELSSAVELNLTLGIAHEHRLNDIMDDAARGNSCTHAIADVVRSTEMRIFGRTVTPHETIVEQLHVDLQATQSTLRRPWMECAMIIFGCIQQRYQTWCNSALSLQSLRWMQEDGSTSHVSSSKIQAVFWGKRSFLGREVQSSLLGSFFVAMGAAIGEYGTHCCGVRVFGKSASACHLLLFMMFSSTWMTSQAQRGLCFVWSLTTWRFRCSDLCIGCLEAERLDGP